MLLGRLYFTTGGVGGAVSPLGNGLISTAQGAIHSTMPVGCRPIGPYRMTLLPGRPGLTSRLASSHEKTTELFLATISWSMGWASSQVASCGRTPTTTT